MSLPNSQKGFAPILVIAIVGLIGLIAVANVPVTQKNSDKSQVQGVLIARGGDDGGSSGGGSDDSGGGSSGSPGGSQDSSSGGPTPIGTPSGDFHGGPPPPADLNQSSVNFNSSHHGPPHNQITDNDHRGGPSASNSGELRPFQEGLEHSEDADHREGTPSADLRHLRLHLEDDEGSAEAELDDENEGSKLTVNGITANAHFPISFDPATNQLFVNTPNGPRPIRTLPDQAARIATEEGIIKKIDSIDMLEATQSGELNEPVIKVKGQKTGKLFGFIPVQADVQTDISQQDGTIIDTTEPFWLKLLSPFIK